MADELFNPIDEDPICKFHPNIDNCFSSGIII